MLRFTALLLLGAALAAPAAAQTPPATDSTQGTSNARRVEGTVVSVRRGSFTLRTAAGGYRVFEIGPTTVPARPLKVGMRVAVVADEEDADVPVAVAVAILADEAPSTSGPAAAAATGDPVPREVRVLESQVERQLRRYNAGIVGGVSVQPELIMVGGHATFERVFRRAVSVRPGVQLGFGELTTLLTVDLDVLYAFPGGTRAARWAPYVGAGPTIGFGHRSLEGEDDDGTRFDFGDFDAEHGFNFIVGMRNRSGAFFEMKATAGGFSDVRLLAGVTF
jgi:hypothetical protein